MGFEDLSPQQRAFVERYLDVSLPVPGGPDGGPAQISITKLSKARLEWGNVRKAALSGTKRLEDILQAEYGDDPAAAQALPLALKTLSGTISQINEKLEDELDAVLNAEESERARLVDPPAATAVNFIALCDSHPILRELDGNEFLPDMNVVLSMKQSLARVVAALGR